VFVKIASNEAATLEQAETVVRNSLLNNLRIIERDAVDHVFELNLLENGSYMLVQNGLELGASDTPQKLFKFFDSILRVSVGEYAVDHVFLHAGVVGWKGKAIVMPADSFRGKSTLVAELVRNGADYYSDDFAVLDKNALVHPYSRDLAMRTEDFKTYDLTVEQLGGKYGKDPIPVGMVLLTGYEPDAVWAPEILSPGNGVLKIIPYVLSIRHRTDFSMRVLHNMAIHAIMASSLKGSTERFVKTILDFVDKHVN